MNKETRKKLNNYTIDEIINNLFNKSYRNSELNEQKINNAGFEPSKKYNLFGNYNVAFFNEHGGIRKIFYKGNKEITKNTIQKAYKSYKNNNLSKKDIEKLKKYLNKREKNGQLTLYRKFGIEKGGYIEAYLIIDTTKNMTKKKHLALANVLSGRLKYKEDYEQLKNEILEGKE